MFNNIVTQTMMQHILSVEYPVNYTGHGITQIMQNRMFAGLIAVISIIILIISIIRLSGRT